MECVICVRVREACGRSACVNWSDTNSGSQTYHLPRFAAKKLFQSPHVIHPHCFAFGLKNNARGPYTMQFVLSITCLKIIRLHDYLITKLISFSIMHAKAMCIVCEKNV